MDHHRPHRIGRWFLLALVGALAVAAPATAATFAVNSTADGAGSCPGSPCTLRAAIAAAAANGDAIDDTIVLPAGTFQLTGGELMVTAAGRVTVVGAGAAATVIRQAGAGRVFHATGPNDPLRLRDLTVRGGRLSGDDPSPDGAGIRATHGLLLDGVVVYDNHIEAGAGFQRGGGVYVEGPVIVTGSTIAGNSATGGGGGLSVTGEGVLISDSLITGNVVGDGGGGGLAVSVSGVGPSIAGRISRTTISDNIAGDANADGFGGQGGGVAGGASAVGELVVEDSLITGNHAAVEAGAWLLGGAKQATVFNTTISANSADGGAGAIAKLYGTGQLTLRHVTLSGNHSRSGSSTLFSQGGPAGTGGIVLQATIVDGKCAGPVAGFVNGGWNVADTATCDIVDPTSVDEVAPGLAALADNGGATPTHAIDATSPASGRVTSCLAHDQRGAGRSAPCDSGAYEHDPSSPPIAPPVIPPPVPVPGGGGGGDGGGAGGGGTPESPVTPGPPAVVAPAVPTIPPTDQNQGSGSAVRVPAALRVRGARIAHGRLTLRVRLAREATGRVKVRLRKGDRTRRLSARIRHGHAVFKRSVQRARGARIKVSYAGDDRVRPARVRLRAGRRGAHLRIRRATLTHDGELRVRGKVGRRVRGRVLVRLQSLGDEAAKTIRIRARIAKGRWKVDDRLPDALAAGSQLSVRYAGDARHRIRGAQLSRRLMPDR